MPILDRAARFPLALALLAALSAPAAAAGKKYFLTVDDFPVGQVRSACPKGFHLATLWEIFEFTALRYDTKRGRTSLTSGVGPPPGELGWIQTGGSASPGPVTGVANCRNFGSIMPMELGSAVELGTSWNDEPTAVSPWVATTVSCAGSLPVWCKQN